MACLSNNVPPSKEIKIGDHAETMGFNKPLTPNELKVKLRT